MASQVYKDVRRYGIKLSQPRTQESEFGKTKKGMQACKKCHAYFYKKSWHHALPHAEKGERAVRPRFTFAVCPACRMIGTRQYEGKIMVEGAPVAMIKEILNLINAYGTRAYKADTQHRIIKVESKKSVIVITTTENQLAVKLAKKIKSTFHASDVVVTQLKNPSDVEVARVIFGPRITIVSRTPKKRT